jgi:hypothetical protein
MPLVQPPIYPGTCWDGADRGLQDRKLKSILPLYRALRRHVWRAIVGVHQACAKGAAAHLNYDTEGALVATSCPVASAYLRWRLYWEGLRVPADLFRPPRHVPFGVLAWLCHGAPVAAESWTARGDQWLAHRVFAMDCIRDFAAWWELCESRSSGAQMRWSRAATGGYGHPYWGASGNDSPTDPLRVFLEARPLSLPSRLLGALHSATCPPSTVVAESDVATPPRRHGKIPAKGAHSGKNGRVPPFRG